jgi:ATP-dependent metalloprotease
MSLGMVMQLPDAADEHSISRRQLLAKLDVAMGGRVAEELIFGERDVTTGASSDLEQVCATAPSACCACMEHAAGDAGA